MATTEELNRARFEIAKARGVPFRPIPSTPEEQGAAAQEGLGTLDTLRVGLAQGAANRLAGARQLLGLSGAEEQADFALRRRQFEGGAGETVAGSLAEGVGAALPEIALGGGLFGLARTGAQRVALGAGLGAVEGLGRFAEDSGERTQNILTGAAFGTAGGLAGEAIGRGLNVLTGRRFASDIPQGLRPDEAQSARAAMAVSQRENIPLVTTDIDPQGFLSSVEDVLPDATRPVRLQQLRRSREAVEEIRDESAGFGGDIGEAVQTSLQATQRATRDQSRELYDLVRQSAGNTRVRADSTINRAQQLLDSQQNIVGGGDRDIVRIAQALVNAPGGPQTMDNLIQLRSQLGEHANRLSANQKYLASSAVTSLKQSVEQDMRALARNAGPDTMRRFNRANAFYRDNVVPLERGRINRAAQTEDPDTIFRMFINPDLPGMVTDKRSMRQLFNALDDNAKNAIRYGIVNDALNRATTNRAFSPATFRNQMDKISQSLGVAFPGDEGVRLKNLIDFMGTINKAGEATARPLTGFRLLRPLIVATGNTLNALGAGVALRALLTTEAGRRFLLANPAIGSKRWDRLIRPVLATVPNEQARQRLNSATSAVQTIPQ